MQFITAVLALAATAIAAPGNTNSQCTFGQYLCAENGASIKQCDITGKWVTVGPCPNGSTCGYFTGNPIPYCIANTPKTKRHPTPPPCTPGTYSCTSDDLGINVCNAQAQLVFNGECPPKSHCEVLNSANGIPFCVSD